MTTHRNVYLVQVNWSDTTGNTSGMWLPYSVGSIWAYCAAVPEINDKYYLADLTFLRSQFDSALATMFEPEVVGLSTYVWNEQFNLQFAEQVKIRWPKTLIVFGGPQVPDRSEGFFEAHPQVDILVHGEGEKSFASILLERSKSIPDYSAIPGCTLNIDGDSVKTIERQRISQLDELPSPYLKGVFERIMHSYPNADWNTVIETNRGCPYGCKKWLRKSEQGDKWNRCLMHRAGLLKALTLSAQSMTPSVLQAIKRENMKMRAFKESALGDRSER